MTSFPKIPENAVLFITGTTEIKTGIFDQMESTLNTADIWVYM